jgi:hypothetical protein
MLPRLLIDETFRVRLVDHHVGDPMVRAFWLNEYAGYGDHFRAEAISPIQNKIGKALIEELWLILGDGVNQAADLALGATSIPSWNLTPWMTFGNWF